MLAQAPQRQKQNGQSWVNIDDTRKITEFSETLDLANNTTMDIMFDAAVPHSVDARH